MPHFFITAAGRHEGFCYTKQWARDKNRLRSSTQTAKYREEEAEEEVEKEKEPEEPK